MNWQLHVIFHYPHDRFAFGWEAMFANDEVPFNTYQIFLGIITVRIDTWEEEEE